MLPCFEGSISFVKYSSLSTDSSNLNNLKIDQVVKLLLESGCWPFIKQRPFDIIANPDEKPKSIHVSCFDSAPLSVDFEFILKDRMDLFKAGLDVLEIICPNILQGTTFKL